MKYPEPTIRVNVDVTNPGHFFACCGLLELADRLWPGAEGWFDDHDFLIAVDGSIIELLEILVEKLPAEVTKVAERIQVKPLIAPLYFDWIGQLGITLDAWMKIGIEKGEIAAIANRPWNFWSGQQTPLRIWTALRNALVNKLGAMDKGAKQYEELFFDRVLLSGRFGFDPGAAWNALDVGFSPNEQNMNVESSVAVEMLAPLGLQRYRPSLQNGRDSFIYATWNTPLSPAVAACAASGVSSISVQHRFLGKVASRGSYAALAYSSPFQGEPHE